MINSVVNGINLNHMFSIVLGPVKLDFVFVENLWTPSRRVGL